jgi:hypothetical protein
MKNAFLILLLVAGAGLLVIVLEFGTADPCGILRIRLRQEAMRQGDLGSAVAALMPDALIDAAVASQFGTLTPGRCLALLVNPTPLPRGPAAPPPPPGSSQQSGFTPVHPKPMCNTQACWGVAELAARQAYDVCRAAAGPLQGTRTLSDPCIQKALGAWLATGAIPPYAHQCSNINAAVDFLGRC